MVFPQPCFRCISSDGLNISVTEAINKRGDMRFAVGYTRNIILLIEFGLN